jgi:beta-lactamase regulating signal transducer with metallopeptidase domain
VTSVVLKATIVLLLALTALQLTRRARASVRHAILAATFAVLLALPAAPLVLPEVAISVPAVAQQAVWTALTTGSKAGEGAEGAVAPSRTPSSVTPQFPPRTQRLSITSLAAITWVIGATAVLLSLVLGLWRLQQLRRQGVPWIEARETVEQLAAQAGIARGVDVLLHECVAAPVTCGLLRPAIVLPFEAKDWSDAPLRRAFVHELEHVRRFDWWILLASRVACGLYWFHPLAWAAYRRLSLEAERACDDAVLAREESTQYAEQLVQLARTMATCPEHPALAMAGRSDLAARISAVLDTHQVRGRAGLFRAVTIGLAAVAIVAAMGPMRIVNAAVTGTSSTMAGSEQGSQRRGLSAWMGRALIESIDEGDIDDVTELLDGGVDVNATVDGDGSPLIVAAREGKVAIVALLLDRGADPNLAVSGDGNPLIMAAREGHLEIVRMLLDRGAHIDQVVPEDENALIQASAEGHLEVVKLLVSRGADVNARAWAERAYERPQGEWRTPLNMALRGGHRLVAAFLQSSGASQ